MEVRASFAVQTVVSVPVQQAPHMIVQEIDEEENPWNLDQSASAIAEVSHGVLPASTVPGVDFWQVEDEPRPADAVPAVHPAQEVPAEEHTHGELSGGGASGAQP